MFGGAQIIFDCNEQLHSFPEGKVCQEVTPIRRLKWGTASLIVRAPVTPIVLPIVHHGLEKVIFLFVTRAIGYVMFYLDLPLSSVAPKIMLVMFISKALH